jgi:GTP-binding protein Era
VPLYPDDFLTDRPQRFFVSELIREQVLRLTRQELPHATAVLIESFVVEPKLIRIHAAILVERESQKGIMIGKAGSLLKTIGTAARREIEGFLGVHVFVGLVVKVRREWREDPRALDLMDVVESDLTAG